MKLYISPMGGKQRKLLFELDNLYWVFIIYPPSRLWGCSGMLHPAAGASRGIERHEVEQAGGCRACEITKMKTEY